MSSTLSQKIFQNQVVQHPIRQQALQLRVLIFKRFELGRVGNFHLDLLGFAFLERALAEALLPPHVGRWHPSFLFLARPNNLGLG